jgi:hypothetical protein
MKINMKRKRALKDRTELKVAEDFFCMETIEIIDINRDSSVYIS